jgi:peptidoglycan hydrolase-like protein with peptidoglycan-binding domain
MIRALICATALAVAAAAPATAEKLALVAGVVEYDELPDAEASELVLELAEALRRSPQITADIRRDVDLQDIRQMSQQFIQMSRSSDGQAIVLAGRFANNGVETFFLPAPMSQPNALRLYEEAVPLSFFLSLLTNAPAGGLLILAPMESEGSSGPNWNWGLGPLAAPENVAIIHGTPRAVGGLVRDILPHSRRTVQSAVNGSRELTAVGELPQGSFVGASGVDPRQAERLAWDLASSLNTVNAYNAYLSRFPSGANADEARRKIRQMTEPTPEEREAALNLTQNQRRDVQRDLSVLGFNTRGIDGIFGPGTRTAISNWQRREGYEVTGFLVGGQVERLHRQADARRAEIQREEEEQRRRERAADNAFWQETGSLGTAAGFRTYLDRYPNGLHADEAKAALARMDEQRRAEERRTWERALAADTATAYRQYLEIYPQGEFAQQARDRIAQIERRDDRQQAVEAARAEEEALNLAPFARLLVERRLSQAGHNPGNIDGNFDANTRNALREFQRDQGIAPTGYLTEETVGSLVAGGLMQLLDR